MRTPASSGLARLDSGMMRACCVGGLIGLWLEAGSAMASRQATEAALTAGRTLCGTRELHEYIREEAMGNIGQPFVVFIQDLMGELRANFCEACSNDAEQAEGFRLRGESQPSLSDEGKQRVPKSGSVFRY